MTGDVEPIPINLRRAVYRNRLRSYGYDLAKVVSNTYSDGWCRFVFEDGSVVSVGRDAQGVWGLRK